ncbi:uncharacterized protein LOC126967236 [Leptidea sinapis]|uniref:uncharacterized protein LOC126967236 n=1 Tax=Leptidea sinapis TaxID=189913 RepID=UPI002130C243|nr:uncharacterized protein LOC126967236 [Leptidea sinapis]
MDSNTSTDDLKRNCKSVQKNLLLEIIKELSCDRKSAGISPKVAGTVSRIIADCDLIQYSNYHRMSCSDNSESAVLGLAGIVHNECFDLTCDEQAELNQAIINKIQSKLPIYNAELEKIKESIGDKKSRKEHIKELQESLNEKLNKLESQESEKVDLMMEWLNHKLTNVSSFNVNSNELLSMKTQILELKSKILHLQILQSIFTETNHSIKAYSEVHKDLQEHIRETEQRIKSYKEIIESNNY